MVSHFCNEEICASSWMRLRRSSKEKFREISRIRRNFPSSQVFAHMRRLCVRMKPAVSTFRLTPANRLRSLRAHRLIPYLVPPVSRRRVLLPLLVQLYVHSSDDLQKLCGGALSLFKCLQQKFDFEVVCGFCLQENAGPQCFLLAVFSTPFVSTACRCLCYDPYVFC